VSEAAESKSVSIEVPAGDGEMAASVRAFDWSSTPLGPMDGWPQSFRVAVDICLNSRFPMFVWWGPQLINIYNDAYVPMLGKRHPRALGRPARESWNDIWAVIGPQADAVMKRRMSTWNERVKLVMERNGFAEDTWFTWSYSPIIDEHGNVGGLFCAVTEETQRVRAETERNNAAQHVAQLHAVTAALSGAMTSEQVAHVAVEQGVAALGASAGSLLLLAEGGKSLEMAGYVGYAAEIMTPWKNIPLEAPVPLTEAVRSGQAIYLHSPQERLERYPVLRDVKARNETVSSACVPLMIADKAVGVMGLSFDCAHPFAAGDREFILSLARQCAQALERARLFEAEREARAEAERASGAKDEFLAALSHELRTPLTPVLLTVSLMEASANLPSNLREDLASIRRNVELESRLISDLLDLTRISKGKLQLEERDVDLHLVIRSAADICQREASAKLTLDLAAARHSVRGDTTRLQQVFWNLINNAIKFTPADGTITVRSENPGGGDETIRVSVTDSGVGIDASVLPKLFNAFEQGEVRALRQQAGLGLGLAISRKLAEAHGGTITAHSDGRGCGATFCVELPLVQVLDGASLVPDQSPDQSNVEFKTTTSSPPASAAMSRKLNVLLVEDHEPTLRAMERLLRQIGHRVTSARSVATATVTGANDGYDVLISDLGLPDGSGLDIIRQLRDRYAGRAIALTGYGMESDVTASREAGFTEHLTKPIDAAALAAAIERLAPAASEE
jgi:signal transduction histidine kinase/ActR/RegA family two-component response regulator